VFTLDYCLGLTAFGHRDRLVGLGGSMRARSIALAGIPAILLGSGCSSLTGKWVGSCEYADSRYGYTSAITVKMEDGSGSEVAGDVVLDMYDGRTFSGRVSGLRSDNYIEMDGTFRAEDGPWDLTLTGDIGEDIIEGECGLVVPLGAGSLSGDLTLER